MERSAAEELDLRVVTKAEVFEEGVEDSADVSDLRRVGPFHVVFPVYVVELPLDVMRAVSAWGRHVDGLGRRFGAVCERQCAQRRWG